jgi:hypothetical protein
LSCLASVISTLFESGVRGDGVPDDLPESDVSKGVVGGDMISVEASTCWLCCA